MNNELIVFPTELALRRFQQEEALKNGWVDASGHTTFSRVRKLCLTHAVVKGQRMDAARQLLVRREVIEVASGHFHGQGALGELSENALRDVLDQLIKELASLPRDTSRVMDWLLDHHPHHKLYQLGMLVSVWRATIKQEGVADSIDENLAILKLLSGPREKWPPLLRDCKQITFRSVRWFNPFEELCVSALNKKLKVRVESALPQAHAEAAADRMGQRIRSEIMAAPWAVWAEDLGDAMAVDSADVLQLSDASRINFSRSAGTYGEIEDLARRICWNLQTLEVPANRIALVVPNIGNVQDIIPHVFSRFRIPYFFRRGRPVLSSACVKAFFAWLAFPLRPERDVRIDLVRNPSIRISNRELEIQRLLKLPPLIEADASALSGFQALDILNETILEPEDHFNATALKVVQTVLERVGDDVLPLNEMVDLLEELLENETVRPRDSHEQGVWILNPHDAVGIDFDVVLFAGLNAGEFPGVPQQDALLSDQERYWLRQYLEEQGRSLPKMALPEADVLFEQQSVLFLTALGMAREQLVFSYQSVDQAGGEKGEGEYFRKLWNLAGWCAQEEIQLSPYDQWRIQTLETDSVFSNHWNTQQSTPSEDREPMPGESFLPIIPLPLCRAKDEALQSAVQQGRRDACGTENVSQASRLLPVEHVVDMLKIEAEREAFLEAPINERDPSAYCGHVPALKDQIAAWFKQKDEMSPTALEALAQNRYIFLIERVFGIRDPRIMDDTPDPMARGTLIHNMLKEIYSAIAEGRSGIDAPRYWAVKSSRGWMLRTEDGVDAIPLVSFAPELTAEYEAFARKTAERMMDRSVLGHPGVWAAERTKVLEMVLNFVRYDAETCAAEKRCPAFFEMPFGGASAVDLGLVKLGGKVDRVDLVFEETGALQKLRVLDYKGPSRSRSKTEEYVDEIVRNLDCQLPVYAFAAQQFFFGAFNEEELNAMTETGYLFYERELSKIGRSVKKSLIPMNQAGMVEGFLETLTRNIQCLENGDFAVDPLLESFNDYQSICRTEAVAADDL
ncbi:PD-(D/E)XK nuclease family protein [Pontiellaceae bacterium B12227]|nr:PD-(D/E)XK nuclease family protein [Pontiellaceae bacterium B12227]